MSYRVKIIGAGSIGNHLAHAARSKGWTVSLTDIDPMALQRTRDHIYPSRYGKWDEAIILKNSDVAVPEPADIVFIGTPPDSHIKVANAVLDAIHPSILMIEKPLCGPDLCGCQALWERAQREGIFVGIGYNHVLGRNTVLAEQALSEGIGKVSTISARTREHWGGIFTAHPWLTGPASSYLGFYRRGGGATGEHSHAINLWQHFAHIIGAGKVADVSATLDIVHEETGAEYDQVCLLALRTTNGLIGDVIQDVVSTRTEKSIRLQGSEGYVEWYVNYEPNTDAVIWDRDNGQIKAQSTLIPKTRADDFRMELDHIESILEGRTLNSPVSLERGLDTMMVIAAAFKSHYSGRRVSINWRAGYTLDALT
jgi:predicted dehydrogenase